MLPEIMAGTKKLYFPCAIKDLRKLLRLLQPKWNLARLKPFARGGSLALRAVPIATAIISHMPVAAGGVLAKGDMAAKRCCAAALDG